MQDLGPDVFSVLQGTTRDVYRELKMVNATEKVDTTINQVLVSIQSLILVPEPNYNEPGLEKNCGTAGGESSRLENYCTEFDMTCYNEGVFKNNLKHAILGQIRAPPEGFSLVTRSHFFHKRESLIKVSYE